MINSKGTIFFKEILFVGIFLMTTIPLFSQFNQIELNNPSFEGDPKKVRTSIRGWFDCGIINFPNESPPDILPSGLWGVTRPASEGKTYLGLVTRDNDTYEGVSQKLDQSIESGKCYILLLDASRSDVYKSAIWRYINEYNDMTPVNFTNPVNIEIWGGDGYCNKSELLFQSEPITSYEWETYSVNFSPENDLNSITIQVNKEFEDSEPSNGHVLVDNLSNIIEVECEKD